MALDAAVLLEYEGLEAEREGGRRECSHSVQI